MVDGETAVKHSTDDALAAGTWQSDGYEFPERECSESVRRSATGDREKLSKLACNRAMSK